MIGSILLLVAIANMITWFIVADSNESFEKSVADYVALFPKLIADPLRLTLINIVLCSGACMCFLHIREKSINVLRKVCIILAVLSGILGFWNIFSLM